MKQKSDYGSCFYFRARLTANFGNPSPFFFLQRLGEGGVSFFIGGFGVSKYERTKKTIASLLKATYARPLI